MEKISSVMRIIIIAIFFILLTGCGDSNISAVKDKVLPGFKSLTLGEALDNYKYFDDTSWETKETENGRKFAEFRATYDAENYLKRTDLKQFYLVIQFIVNSDKSFNLAYAGREEVYKNGDIKEVKLNISEYFFRSIYNNKNTFMRVAPESIVPMGYKFADSYKETLGDLLCGYDYFTDVKWQSSWHAFTGHLKVSNDFKNKGVTDLTIKIFRTGKIQLSRKFKNGKEYGFTCNEKKHKVFIDKLFAAIKSNDDISNFFNPVMFYKSSSEGKGLLGNKHFTDKSITASLNSDWGTFTGAYPVDESTACAGIVERKIIAEFASDFASFNCYLVTKFRNGKTSKIDFQNDTTKLFLTLADGDDIKSFLDPLRLFLLHKDKKYLKLRGYFSTWIRKFIEKRNGRSYYLYERDIPAGDICSYWDDRKNYNILKKYKFKLVMKMSFNPNGEDIKFSEIKFLKTRYGKAQTIKCSTSFDKKTKLPNVLYCIQNEKSFLSYGSLMKSKNSNISTSRL